MDNEGSPRFGSVVDVALQKAWQVFHLLLPGTAFVYYGDEIAMVNGVVGATERKDPLALVPGQVSHQLRFFCCCEFQTWRFSMRLVSFICNCEGTYCFMYHYNRHTLLTGLGSVC